MIKMAEMIMTDVWMTAIGDSRQPPITVHRGMDCVVRWDSRAAVNNW
jgi:hypothetical protein